MTLGLARAIAAIHNCETINGIPFCKEYQSGTCSRGGQRCRYWHINIDEERERRRRVPRGLPSVAPPPLPLTPYVYPPRRHMLADTYDSLGATTAAAVAAVAGKRARYDFNDDYRRELERKNMELSKENESLKRELMRERDRYEALYSLFRQRTTGGGGGSESASYSNASSAVPGTAAYYQAAAATNWADTQWTH